MSDLTEVQMVRIPPCDIGAPHGDAAYDGKTRLGPWAYMCETHFEQLGVGLGLGKGQRLILKEGSDK